MSTNPNLRHQAALDYAWLMRQDAGTILEMKAEGSEEPGQTGTQSELWKKMFFLILSTLVEQAEQPSPSMKPKRDTPSDKDFQAQTQKAPSKSGSHRGGGRSSRSHSDNEDEERDGRKKRKLSTEHDDSDVRRRLKCPFYLRCPEKHRRGSCRGEGFADMGKLKDHLKRVHQKPRRCTTCWKDLPTDEALEAHDKLEQPCTRNPEPEDDRVTAETLRELNFSRVPYANQSVEEKWKRLYSDLFPNEEDIPSPYEDYGLGPDFDKMLAQRLEKEFANEFARATERLDRVSLYERLVDIIRDCRKKKTSGGSDPSPTSRPGSVVSNEPESVASTDSQQNQPGKS